jgi:hypothetical protein
MQYAGMIGVFLNHFVLELQQLPKAAIARFCEYA